MITIGACSPPCSSSEIASTLVDSASPGRKDVDSLFSASAYLPGRFAASAPTSTSRQAPRITNFAVRPAGRVMRRVTRSDRTAFGGCARRTGSKRIGPVRIRRVLALAGVVALTATAAAQASFTQEPGSPFKVFSGGPYDVLPPIDFNRDGRLDVATINGDSATVSVLLRQPASGFALEGSPVSLGM